MPYILVEVRETTARTAIAGSPTADADVAVFSIVVVVILVAGFTETAFPGV